ncbi:MAG: DUF2800 domain-containing protein, partial [bacterium]|nr:DUF2800 domain-containing protein [bacterium]
IFGTCDRCVVAGDLGLLIDYKFGVHKVPYPEKNLQAIAYSIGAFQKFPKLRKLVFAFIAPKRGETHHCHFHRDEMETLKTEVKGVIRTAKRVRKQLERGIVSRGTITMLRPDSLRCEYCAFNDGRCPATADYAAGCADGKPPSEILDELNEQLKKIPLLEAYITAVKQRAREMVLEYGEELADFRVETRAGARSITSVDAAWAAAEQAGVDIADFLAIVKTLPITHYEKLFGDKDKTREALKNLAAEGAITSGEEVHYLKRRI